jgi:hypothetical protein
MKTKELTHGGGVSDGNLFESRESWPTGFTRPKKTALSVLPMAFVFPGLPSVGEKPV